MDIDAFKKAGWREAVAFFEDENHLFLASLCGDRQMMDSAILAKDHGPVAGASYIAALLFNKEHGGNSTVLHAAYMYGAVLQKIENPQLFSEVENMVNWVAWAGSAKTLPYCNHKWPLPVPKEVWMEHAGLMNLMLKEGAANFNCESNSHLIALNGVVDFLGYLSGRKSRR